jgi:PPE-repeat protein
VVAAQGLAYIVGGLTAAARRSASTSAKSTGAETAAAAALAAAAATEVPGKARRRRRSKSDMLGRGFEYMDLEPEPTVLPSGQSGGTLGFPRTAVRETTTAAAGLTTLADDDFGGGPRMPMMPGTWIPDTPEG